MARSDFGSISKEFPFDDACKTLEAITPGMAYADLREFARRHTHPDIPGLLKNRFLFITRDGHILYDHLLSLIHTEGTGNVRVRKAMYFVWAFRDERLRRFVAELPGGYGILPN